MNSKQFRQAAALAGLNIEDQQLAQQEKAFAEEMLSFIAPLAQVTAEGQAAERMIDFDALRTDTVVNCDGTELVTADKRGEDGCYKAPLAVN